MKKTKYNESSQPEGNYYDKYNSQNPIVKKLMENFFLSLDRLILSSGISGGYILEAGCGEGHVTEFIKQEVVNAKVEAFDISEKIIRKSQKRRPDIYFFVHNIYDSLDEKQYDLVVCCEVLEHMERPWEAVKSLMEHGERFIFSVPHEPIWRIMNMARGKYIKNLGNTPGHIQHFTKSSFYRMLKECGLQVIEYEKPFPWLMVFAQKL